MLIRRAERNDVPAMLDIYNYEVINGVATLDIKPREVCEWYEWYDVHAKNPHHIILAAETDGVVAGYASLSEYRQKEAYKSTAELSVYVGADFRRMGIAASLLDRIIKFAKEEDTLHTIVSVITAGNEASEKLHEKFGFDFCGTIKEVGVKFGKYRDIDNYSLKV